ncbi:MAG: hypothetical protein KBE91_06610 [Bacteroidia bacterium]|nr:hypothetical protein [Bacteroidia bacterium]
MSKLPFLFVFLFVGVLFNACKKDVPLQNEVVRKLYHKSSNLAISECNINGKKIYCSTMLVYDGGTTVYDENGTQIGHCNYAWGPVDSICSKLTDCEVVYRAANNMFKLPFIDKYGLSKQ